MVEHVVAAASTAPDTTPEVTLVGNAVSAFLRYKGKKKPRPALSSLNLGLLGLPW